MAKRLPTALTNIKQYADSGIYVYRKGAYEKTLETKDWEEAVRRANLIEIDRETFGIKSVLLRVNDVSGDYINEKRLQKEGKIPREKPLSEGSFKEIKWAFKNHLTPTFGPLKLIEINEKRWKTFCYRSRLNDLKNIRKVFTGFLKWCKYKGYLKALPDITDIPHHVRRQRYVVTPEEIKTIFKNASGNLLTFLSLALFNGLRRKEIMTLRWDLIDLEDKKLSIDKSQNKLRRSREIPINDQVVEVLRAHKNFQIESGILSPWVFPNARDSKRHASESGFKTSWNTIRENCDYWHITWHDFRATFEKYANKSKEHTDMQKEKFADASIEVQSRIYVTMTADDLRGLENVVQVEGLNRIIGIKTKSICLPDKKAKSKK